jgi:hypothetical protein
VIAWIDALPMWGRVALFAVLFLLVGVATAEITFRRQ